MVTGACAPPWQASCRECSSSQHCVGMAVCSPGSQLAEIPQQWKLQGTDESRKEMGSVLQCKENLGEGALGSAWGGLESRQGSWAAPRAASGSGVESVEMTG